MKKYIMIFSISVIFLILIFNTSTVLPISDVDKEESEITSQISKDLIEIPQEKEIEEIDDIEEDNQELHKRQFIICIDPGHQSKANLEQEPIGPGSEETKIKVSQGTRGVTTGKPEYVLNMEASLILEEIMIEKGVAVVMTRRTNDVDISNKERAEMANEAGADLFVRIHADGSNDANMKGAHILIPAKDSPYTASIAEESERAAKTVLKYLENNVDLAANSLTYRKDISGFNWSEVPVILLEMGFMTNSEEDRKLSNDEYLRNLMELAADGIMEYLITEADISN